MKRLGAMTQCHFHAPKLRELPQCHRAPHLTAQLQEGTGSPHGLCRYVAANPFADAHGHRVQTRKVPSDQLIYDSTQSFLSKGEERSV